MNRITVFIENSQWMARYTGEDSSEITRLFGTDTIPTAFLARATATHVRLEIARLNPGWDVVIATA